MTSFITVFDGTENKKEKLERTNQLMKSFAPGKIEKIRQFQDVKFHLGICFFLIKNSNKRIESELPRDTMIENGN